MARAWTKDINSRGYDEICCEGEHVTLSELKSDPQLDNRYLRERNIPPYPKSLVFYVSNVKHVTGESGLRGIFKDGGFRIPHYEKNNNLLCFSLSVTEDDIAEAEKNFLHQIFPNGRNHIEPFLDLFTTSPAFQRESRYGNFSFNFTLKELLRRYASQFCKSTAPVFRKLGTKIYQKEIMYLVLVHPRHIAHYNHYPRLSRDDEEVCGYFQGQMSWRCQAPSSAHGQRLKVNKNKGTLNVYELEHEKYYMWDHVTVAFHMESNWVLRVNQARLYNSVKVCKVSQPKLLRDPDVALSKKNATKILKSLARE